MTYAVPVVRVAHAYGNNRTSLDRALAGATDMIEADMWYRDGRIFIRHERRAGPLPMLYDSVMRGHKPGPLALRIGRYFVRPDVNALGLDELLDRVSGEKRLLLDVKGRYDGADAAGFAETLMHRVRAHDAVAWAAVCGQTYPVVDALYRSDAQFELRYSIEEPEQWEKFQRRRAGDKRIRAACIQHQLFRAEEFAQLAREGLSVYCWTVDDSDTVERLVSAGVEGIISNNLSLLASLN